MSESQIPKSQDHLLICDENFEDSPPKHQPEPWTPILSEYIENLIANEKKYFPDILAFTRQKDINGPMRTLLLDWLMEICSEFFLRRETFYLALSHIDRLISIAPISRDEFQLIGIASLYLACKSEEIKVPKIGDFVKAASSVYPSSSIIKAEKKILIALKWQVYPPTTYSMLNAVLVEWDRFIMSLFKDYCEYVMSLHKDKIKQQDLLNKRLETYKQENTYSYKRFREITQVLDASMLDFSVYQFKPCRIVAALVYLMVNRGFFQDKYELLWWNTFVLGYSNSLTDEEVVSIGSETVHILLEKFLSRVFNIISIEALTDPIRHLSRFIEFNFCYKLPPVVNVIRNVQENYENFLSYQTYNAKNKEFLIAHPSKED